MPSPDVRGCYASSYWSWNLRSNDKDWVGIVRLGWDTSLYFTLTVLLILNDSPEASFATRPLVGNNSLSAAKVWLAQDHRQLQVKTVLASTPAQSKQKHHLHKTWLRANPKRNETRNLSQSSVNKFIHLFNNNSFVFISISKTRRQHSSVSFFSFSKVRLD